MNWFTRLDGAWDVQPWGVMPQSAQLTEWLSNHPRSVLIVAGFLFVVLVVLARQLARWLPAGGAFLTNAGALIFLPYWVTTFQVDRLAGAAGVAASIACATYGCRLGMTEQHFDFGAGSLKYGSR